MGKVILECATVKSMFYVNVTIWIAWTIEFIEIFFFVLSETERSKTFRWRTFNHDLHETRCNKKASMKMIAKKMFLDTKRRCAACQKPQIDKLKSKQRTKKTKNIFVQIQSYVKTNKSRVSLLQIKNLPSHLDLTVELLRRVLGWRCLTHLIASTYSLHLHRVPNFDR